MGVKGKRVIKLIAFFAVLAVLWAGASKVLEEKFYFSIKINSPETETWKEFYALEKNSLDVLFLGSSHVYNGINPVVFYEETGMRGFDLSSSNQDVYMSYVYLQEALKYQKPEYVVLDAAMFNRGVFASQKYYEMSFDSMKFSKLKLDCLKEWKELDPEQRIADRLVPLLAYHSRWEELRSWDFSDKNLTTAINGYIPSHTVMPVNRSEYDENDPLWDIPVLTRSYFEKLSNLCFENDIELILIIIPDSTARFGKTEPVKMLAWDYDLTCLDYNEYERYEALGLDYSTDFKDQYHLNTYGADKFTKVLGQDLQMYGGMYGKGDKERSDPKWQKLIKEWEPVRLRQYLPRITDMHEYLDVIAGTDYTIFVAVADEGMCSLDDDLRTKLRNLGFDADFENGKYMSFYGVNDRSSVVFELENHVLEKEGKLKNGKYWKVYSASFANGDAEGKVCQAVIEIGGVDYSRNGRGMNFVIYNEERDEVVDTVSFDSYKAEIPCSR